MNSVLCRLALTRTRIDAASFTAARLSCGALVLALLISLSRKRRDGGQPSWISAGALFAYAAAFSVAYLRLSAGVGALILFGAVQLSMTSWGVLRGERPTAVGWLGLALAVSGLVVLTLPGQAAPDVMSASLMALSGVSWGIYSLRGRGQANPTSTTAGNFIRSVPFVVVMWLVSPHASHPTEGLLLAALSGGLTSAGGYVLWYAALRGLLATQASVVQLSVPVLTAALGVLLLGEHISLRLAAAGALILSGIALAIRSPQRR
ncbi:MAG: DMT family transporter [Polyangiaceae bacterium]